MMTTFLMVNSGFSNSRVHFATFKFSNLDQMFLVQETAAKMFSQYKKSIWHQKRLQLPEIFQDFLAIWTIFLRNCF